MTTATIRTLDQEANRRPGFGRLLLSEWTKIRSVRSTVWSLVLLVVLDLGFTGLITGVTAAQWDKLDAGGKASLLADPTNQILGGGLGVSQLAVCVLGVMVISSEYSTGMIRASLLAVPRRLPMLAAKIVVFGVLILVLATAVAFGSFLMGSSILHSRVAVSLSDPGVLRAVFGAGLYIAMIGLFALALGGIIRHTAAGITGVIGFVLVLAPLTQLIPGRVGDYVYAYMPSVAGALILKTHQGKDDLLTPWQGYEVFALWTVVLMVIAAVVLMRRDA